MRTLLSPSPHRGFADARRCLPPLCALGLPMAAELRRRGASFGAVRDTGGNAVAAGSVSRRRAD